MARLVVKIRHKNNICCNEIGLCAQITDIDLGSIMNTTLNMLALNLLTNMLPCDSQLLFGRDNYRADLNFQYVVHGTVEIRNRGVHIHT